MPPYSCCYIGIDTGGMAAKHRLCTQIVSLRQVVKGSRSQKLEDPFPKAFSRGLWKKCRCGSQHKQITRKGVYVFAMNRKVKFIESHSIQKAEVYVDFCNSETGKNSYLI
jgi:hypothetical protein